MNKQLLKPFGLKWNPFTPDVPAEGLYASAALQDFLWKLQNIHLQEGGFACIRGANGSGKSTAMRFVSGQLMRLPDLKVGAFTRPSSGVGDFYRELGDLFGVPLRPHNRWGGFKALRDAWRGHIDTTPYRPVIFIDEAQDLQGAVANELRLLSSTDFDSRNYLCVVLAGDGRLPEHFKTPQLAPIASRIRAQLKLETLSPDELLEHLRFLLSEAGNSKLMTPELMDTVCAHSDGNLRALTILCNELLITASRLNCAQLDEKLFLEYSTARPTPVAQRREVPARRR